MFCRCVLDPGEKIIDCPPTFSMYVFDAAVNGAGVIKGERFVISRVSLSSIFFSQYIYI